MGRYQNDISWLRDAIGAAGGSHPSPGQLPAAAEPGLAAAIGDEKVVEEKHAANLQSSALEPVGAELVQRSTAKPVQKNSSLAEGSSQLHVDASADCREALEEPDVEATTAAKARATSGTT
jgi:hypothetical protein